MTKRRIALLAVGALASGLVTLTAPAAVPILTHTSQSQQRLIGPPDWPHTRPATNPSTAGAQNPADEVTILPVGSTLWSGFTDVSVIGGYAYCSLPYGLVILDVSVPSAPTVASQLSFANGRGEGVCVSGSYLYLADGDAGLRIIDVSNPSSPLHLIRIFTPSAALKVRVVGNTAYVALGSGGLQIYDVSNPAAPAFLGSFACYAFDVSVLGSLAYVAANVGLLVVDVSHPVAPVLVGSYSFGGAVRGVDVVDTLVFVTGGWSVYGYDVLWVVNIANPSAPAGIGGYRIAGKAWSVRVSGQYAYLVNAYPDSTSGLEVVDISNPTLPVGVSIYNEPGSSCSVDLVAGMAFVASRTGVYCIDVTSPATPSTIGKYYTPWDVIGTSSSGSIACVTTQNWGIADVDLSNPAAPAVVSPMVEWGTPRAAEIRSGFAYVADRSKGLRIYDISTPSNPILKGSVPLQDAYNIALGGPLAFVACLTQGLKIVDVSNPNSPALLGTYQAPYGCMAVAVEGNVAYALYTFELRMIDVTNPTSPSLIGSAAVGYAQDVAVRNGIAYVANAVDGLQVIDVSTPSSPVTLASYVTGAVALSVTVYGDYAFMGGDLTGVDAVNISNPASPYLAGQRNTPGSAREVVVNRGHLLVADYAGLSVLSFKTPRTRPVAVGQDVVVAAGPNCQASVAASDVDNGSWDELDGSNLSLALVPSGPFPLGTTAVRLIATDSNGEADTCQATVTVRDFDRPAAQCQADTVVNAPPGEPWAIVSFSTSVSDNCPGAFVTSEPPAGTYFNGGVTHVTCIATDAAGNKDTCGFNITVNVCICLNQGDVNNDGLIDVFDVIGIIDIAFSGNIDPQDPGCPLTRGDVDNSGTTDVFDVIYLLATAFSGGPNPVDPCNP